MRIEIAARKEEPTKVKGDLLETLASDILATQNYEVFEQVRLTGAEFDLLARHRVNGRTIYAECKAHRGTLSANDIFNLQGKTHNKGYSEGWLISAGPFGKDATGTALEWESRPQPERERFSFYTPMRVIEALSAARTILQPSSSHSEELYAPGENSVPWTLIITEFGRFWMAPILQGGLPKSVRVLSATDCSQITDVQLLAKLEDLDTSYHGLKFVDEKSGLDLAGSIKIQAPIVEIQEAETWRDYRPSRPSDFVGRGGEQSKILNLLEAVGKDETRLRAFAITGGTGMGKSSLVAKIRSKSRARNLHKKAYVFAVDCRAAEGASYIGASLLKGLRSAASDGFGSLDPDSIRIENNSDPVSSPSITAFLNSLGDGRSVCIIFDQFEELYTRA